MKFQATKENPAPLITIGTQLQNGPKIDLASLVIGAATIGILGVTGTLSHLWLLLTLLLFRKKKLVWHGLLTADENRYIELNYH